MDIKIEQPKGFKAFLRRKNWPYIFIASMAILILWVVCRDTKSTLKVNKQIVTIVEVKRGEFNDYARVTGQVKPITTVQISPLEGGVVEQIVVEEGATVKRGDIIVRLSNNNLNLSILDSEAQLAEKQNFLRNTQVTMEQEKLRLRQEQLSLNLEVKRKQRAYEQQNALYHENLIAKEDWLIAKEDYELAVDKRALVLERQRQDSIYRSVQVEQMQESLENMRQNMMLVRQRVENLNVRAVIDGELGLLDVVMGQSVHAGEMLGQVNDLSSYKIEAKIDEHYIDRVTTGLFADFERQDKNFETQLRKLYPEVRDGQFKADFKFTSDKPDNIRAGQTYYLNLQLGQPAQAILLPRGPFYQRTGGNWIYVVDEKGENAYRRNIKISRQNPNYYEISEGLAPGERVIVSNYDQYGESEILLLK